MKRRSKLTPEQQQLVSQALPHASSPSPGGMPGSTDRVSTSKGRGGSVALSGDCQIRPREEQPEDLGVLSRTFRLPGSDAGGDPGEEPEEIFPQGSIPELGWDPRPDGVPIAEQIAARAEHQVDLEEDKQLLRGLDNADPDDRLEVDRRGGPAEGDLAQSLGVSEARTSELRTSAMEFLRQRAIA